MRDPEDEERILFLTTKNNLGKYRAGLLTGLEFVLSASKTTFPLPT
jgi:hypothetical protein